MPPQLRSLRSLGSLQTELDHLQHIDARLAPTTALVRLDDLVRDRVAALGDMAALVDSPVYLSAEPITACVDPGGVERVVTDLLVDALTFGAGSPVDVVLTRDGGRAVLVVHDRGAQAPEDVPRARARFADVRRAHGRALPGIGMLVACRIVEAHGGALERRRRPGGGQTVVVELPLDVATLRAPAVTRAPEGAAATL